jgi:mercuric ion binding protein
MIKMKNIFMSILFLVMFTLVQTSVIAQTKMKTDTITVFGNCGQCKERIEEASYIKGVKHAEWSKKTKILTVLYNPKKTSMDKIESAIAKAGHDSNAKQADDVDYKKLPSCCAYRTGTCDHD